LATTQLEEGICWFEQTVWENLLYSSYLSTISWTLFSTSRLSMQPHSARVMIKSVTDTVDACFIDSDDSDSLLTVMST